MLTFKPFLWILQMLSVLFNYSLSACQEILEVWDKQQPLIRV